LYGQVADIEIIKNICDKYGVFLIEDSAESMGATFNGKHSGTFGKAGIYSFNGNKIITTGGGGVLISDDEKLIKEAKFLSTQAKENFIYYEHKTFGYNYRMSNITAGIGRGQMEILDSHIKRRRDIFKIYKNALENHNIEFMPELENSFGNRWLTTILFKDNQLPNKIMEALNKENIESRPLWKPMHLQPIFKDFGAKLSGVSEDLFARGLCLPSGSNMLNEDIERVIKFIKIYINGK
jgi:UDP-N-acetylbacillosamine transaminase